MTARTTPAAASKTKPADKPHPAMCVVTIATGPQYAMPMADGLAVMRAISGAVEVQRCLYSQPDRYQVLRPAQAELRMIHPDQLLPMKPDAI